MDDLRRPWKLSLAMLLLTVACGEDADGAGSDTTPSHTAGTGETVGAAGHAGERAAPAAGDASHAGSGGGEREGGSEGDQTPSAGNGGSAGSASGDAGTEDSAGDAPGNELPSVQDYAAPGPFDDAEMIPNQGPGGNYTLFRPTDSLGRDGFQHPIAAWGNGISTTPDQYESTLVHLATHGFVIAACNDMEAERPCLSDGLDWLVAQNESTGPLQGMLDTETELTLGYSWGGGAAIDTADRPNVKATASLWGMPPRGDDAFEEMHSPLILFTSTGDTFVDPPSYVTPNYEASQVQTFYATRDGSEGHLYILDEGAISCVASVALGGPCGNAMEERAPLTAWLRLWAYGDEEARPYFYGDDCLLCDAPWTAQRKHWE